MTLLAVDTNINQGLLEDLLAIYNEAEHIMADKVAKRVAKGITETGWNEDAYTSITSLREDIERTLNDVSKKAQSKVSIGLLKAYKNGVNGAEVDKGVKKTLMKDLFISAPLQNLLLSTNKLVSDVHVQVLRNVEDKYRKIQAEATSMLLTGVETRVQASQRMLNKMADAGITSFIDKSGRSWNLASYSEMAVRTVSSHAAIQGYIDKLQDLDQDLVKVSSIGATCPLCAKWQGVALSISGKTPGYITVDSARSQGLFHPNCKHRLIMYDEELDGEARREPNSEAAIKRVTGRYDLVQKQRSHERQIRYWKRRLDLAVTPEEKDKAMNQIRVWQKRTLQFCKDNNLTRRYEREGLRIGRVGRTNDLRVGDHLKKYEVEKGAGFKFSGIMNNKDIDKRFKDQFMKSIEGLNSDEKLLIDKALSKVPVVPGMNYTAYNINYNHIGISNKVIKDTGYLRGAIPHEIFHSVDYNSRLGINKWHSANISGRETLMPARKAIREHERDIVKEIKRLKNSDERLLVEDLFNSVMGGKSPAFEIDGHDEQYYKKNPTGTYAAEAYANYFSLKANKFDRGIEIVNKYIPGIEDDYKKILEDIIKKLNN